jgi:1,4-alpha-glucan branching enzyme
VAVCNFSGRAYSDFRIGVPAAPAYRMLINSDAAEYGGRTTAAWPLVKTERTKRNGQPVSLTLNVPPLAFILLEPLRSAGRQRKMNQ